MGIESEQLVYDYLSRVGDIAQQRQLSSGARMELVASLRGEIERQRAQTAAETPASVRRILGRLGTPAEVVDQAADTPPRAAPPGATAFPRAAAEPERPAPGSMPGSGSASESVFGKALLPAQRVRKLIPRPRKDRAAPAVPPPPSPPGLPPHLAGLDELGPSTGSGPDLTGDGEWWSVEPRPYGAGERVGGFTGGVEIPEILRPPREDDESEEDAEADGDGDDGDGDGEEAEPPRPGLLPRLLSRRAKDPEKAAAVAVAAGLGSPILLVAALLLLGGAIFGSWIALAAGWLIAYGSRRLGPVQTKIAVLGIPGTAVAAGILWLWGRATGRWGDPLPDEAMRDAFVESGPWVLRGAAVASALYLVWRARRV
ncbi:hypothetical protein ABZ714_01225 [Streptomyces sp. NPDC006798]|uniref:hypothetical protein n=1 Tax=Streptomyces sp. NPDC006798 TaxID=3155462 RepID=UPI003406DECE